MSPILDESDFADSGAYLSDSDFADSPAPQHSFLGNVVRGGANSLADMMSFGNMVMNPFAELAKPALGLRTAAQDAEYIHQNFPADQGSAGEAVGEWLPQLAMPGSWPAKIVSSVLGAGTQYLTGSKALGLLGGLAGPGIISPVRRIASSLTGKTPSLTPGVKAIYNALAGVPQAELASSMDELASGMKAGVPINLGETRIGSDLTPLASKVLAQPEARAGLAESLASRENSMYDRAMGKIGQWASTVAPDAEGLPAAREAMDEAVKRAGTLFDDIKARFPVIKTERLAELFPAKKKGEAKLLTKLAAKVRSQFSDRKDPFSSEVILGVKTELGNYIKNAAKEGSSDLKRLKSLETELVDAIDEATGGLYKPALDTYASKMAPVKAAKFLVSMFEKTGSPGAAPSTAVKNLASKASVQKKLTELIGEDEAQKIISWAKEESKILSTPIVRAAKEAKPSAAEIAKSIGFVGALRGPRQLGADTILALQAAKRWFPMNTAKAKEIAKALTNPRAGQGALEQALKAKVEANRLSKAASFDREAFSGPVIKALGLAGGASSPRPIRGASEVKASPAKEKPVDVASLIQSQPPIIQKIIQAESSGKSGAVSSKGAKGLMQLMDETGRARAKELGEEYRPHDPVQNVKLGVAEYNHLKKRFGDVRLALAAYNWGQGNLQRLIDRLGTDDYSKLAKFLPEETRNYVSKIA